MLKQKDEEVIEEDEKERCQEASKNWNAFYEQYLREHTAGSGNLNKEEYDRGQKPKELAHEVKEEPSPVLGRKNLPATPPPDIAIGQRKRLRRLLAINIEPTIINDSRIRSEFLEDDFQRKLLVNKKFPGYKKRDGDFLYLYETCCLEQAKPEKEDDMSVNEYLKRFNEIYSAFCAHVDKNQLKI